MQASKWTCATSSRFAIPVSAVCICSWASNRPPASSNPRALSLARNGSRRCTGRMSGGAPGCFRSKPISRGVGAGAPRTARTCSAARISARRFRATEPAFTVMPGMRTVAPWGCRGSPNANCMFSETSMPTSRQRCTRRSLSSRRPHRSTASTRESPTPCMPRRNAAESRVRHTPSALSAGATLQTWR